MHSKNSWRFTFLPRSAPEELWPRVRFRDPAVPKLSNLDRAEARGLIVPPTAWAPADALSTEAGLKAAASEPALRLFVPCVVRSGSPTEDTRATSNAGQLRSEVVRRFEDLEAAIARVVEVLPRGGDGLALGVVFVQPLVEARRAGVTFSDGFYWEETEAEGGNTALTSGAERGEVRRGHSQRADAHTEWLARLHRVERGAIDVEWAEPAAGWSHPLKPETKAGERVVLQVRPALFPVRRNETLSLANHKEILGDPPSPWMVGLLADVGRPVMRYYESIDPAVAAWDEPYAVELAGRAWLNFSAFFRLMDRWGLPRSMVTEGVGGESGGPADGRVIAGRFVRSVPRLLKLQWANLSAMRGIGAGFEALDRTIGSAGTLAELQKANAEALDFAIRSNFAINGTLLGLMRARRWLGLEGAGRSVTGQMMEGYAKLREIADPAERLAALDAWLARHGHRGPLESDPMHPRFAEMRDLLRADLARNDQVRASTQSSGDRRTWKTWLARPFYVVDEVRESFRDRLMRRWEVIRRRILEEAGKAVQSGHLDRVEDVFFLRRVDLESDVASWRERAAEGRRGWVASKQLDLPNTADRDTIEERSRRARLERAEADGAGRFEGIGLGTREVRGTVVRAGQLAEVLGRSDLPESAVLVVSSLEPSWAVVFPRFSAVVSALGGELSHAAILLREGGIPAVVNAPGVDRLRDGARVRVSPGMGVVEEL